MNFNPMTSLQGLVADTVVTVQARDPVSMAADVAVVAAALVVVVLSVVAVRLLLRWRRTLEELRRAVHQNLGPVSDRARTISDNVQFITQALRTDVERLNASVRALTDRLHQASDRMEDRIEEFNALMEVVQSEAEDIFLDTAATVHGVRAGARAVTSGRRLSQEWREAADRALEELKAAGEAPAGEDDTSDVEPVPADRAGEH